MQSPLPWLPSRFPFRFLLIPLLLSQFTLSPLPFTSILPCSHPPPFPPLEQAPPYIPNWQRVYFDTPAHEFSFLTFSQLECMLGGGKSSHGSRAWRNVSGGDDVMQCVATQQVSGSWGQGDRGLEFWRQIEDTLLRLLAPQPGPGHQLLPARPCRPRLFSLRCRPADFCLACTH